MSTKELATSWPPVAPELATRNVPPDAKVFPPVSVATPPSMARTLFAAKVMFPPVQLSVAPGEKVALPLSTMPPLERLTVDPLKNVAEPLLFSVPPAMLTRALEPVPPAEKLPITLSWPLEASVRVDAPPPEDIAIPLKVPAPEFW